jgi:hypothetical protein
MSDNESSIDEASELPEAVADAWAAVLIDIYEKHKAAGDCDTAITPSTGEPHVPHDHRRSGNEFPEAAA